MHWRRKIFYLFLLGCCRRTLRAKHTHLLLLVVIGTTAGSNLDEKHFIFSNIGLSMALIQDLVTSDCWEVKKEWSISVARKADCLFGLSLGQEPREVETSTDHLQNAGFQQLFYQTWKPSQGSKKKATTETQTQQVWWEPVPGCPERW